MTRINDDWDTYEYDADQLFQISKYEMLTKDMSKEKLREMVIVQLKIRLMNERLEKAQRAVLRNG